MRRSPLLLAVPVLLLGAGLACAQSPGEPPPPPAAAPAPPALESYATVQAGWVTLRVPSGQAGRPELARLAASLDRSAREMAARIPLASAAVTVVLEPGYVEQALRTERIGEAVPGPPGDLHLVYHPDDLFAYRHALARVLLSRSPAIAGRVPPGWLLDGAALWLSHDWYGRPYPEWIPRLAAARVLPTAEELLPASGEEQQAASRVLWTPAAAAVVDRLPGSTLAEKLAAPPTRERTAEILARLAPPPSPSLPSLKSLSSSSPRRPPFLKGVSFAMLNRLEGGYHAPSVDRQLDRLKKLGANSVSVMPFAAQRAPDSPNLVYLNRHPRSETDIGLIHATRRARALGLRVLYKPHIWVSHDSWPGDVVMKSEQDWALWWERYRRYVLHHAVLAGWARAELFSVGVELSKTVHREREWRDLIASTRLFYPGLVTYAGNWHGDLEEVGFWDATDLIGVDAYFPLSASPEAARAELEQGARGIAQRLAAASRRHGRPVLLTEVGFAARQGAWIAPHEEGGEYSEADQALAYEALFKALGRPRWLAGTYVWKAFSDDVSDTTGRARVRSDFRFLGREAEAAVRKYYQAR